MAMLFSHAEATERMVALPATADGGQKIDPDAARQACRLWLEALGVTRSRKSVHASSQLRLVVARPLSSVQTWLREASNVRDGRTVNMAANFRSMHVTVESPVNWRSILGGR